MIERLAARCYRSRRLVVVAWIVLLAGLNILGGAFAGETSDDFSLPDSESQRALEVLTAAGFAGQAGTQAQIVFADPGGIARDQARITALLDGVRAGVADAEVTGPFDPGGERLTAPDGTVAYATVGLPERDADDLAADAARIEALRDTTAGGTLQVELGGSMFAAETSSDASGPPAEAIGVLAAVVILLVAFGSVLAMGLPIVVGIFGAGCGMAAIMLAANVIELPGFAGAAAAMVAIGVGIDYALLVVTRYREALAGGADPATAVGIAASTAGRSVLFAGITVVLAVLGLLTMGLGLINGVAVGIAASVLMTMLAALTLLPALLGFAGRNIDRLSLPWAKRHRDPDAAPAARWSRAVQRRPLPYALGALALLLTLAAPVTELRLGFGDAGLQPADHTARRAYDLLSRGFGPGSNGPLVVAAELPPGGMGALTTLSERIRTTPGVASVSPPIPNPAGTAAIVQVIPATAPRDEATGDLVHRLREEVVPAALGGTGVVASVGGSPRARSTTPTTPRSGSRSSSGSSWPPRSCCSCWSSAASWCRSRRS